VNDWYNMKWRARRLHCQTLNHGDADRAETLAVTD
jgi:hypothetical protein